METKQKEALSKDQLFDQQKTKVRLIAEIFDNRLFEDYCIKKILSFKNLNERVIKVLRIRIERLKLIKSC